MIFGLIESIFHQIKVSESRVLIESMFYWIKVQIFKNSMFQGIMKLNSFINPDNVNLIDDRS